MLYVFSNPEDSDCLPSLHVLRSAICKCLDKLSCLGYRSVAMIHIPAAVNGRSDDVASAKGMIEAIRSWDQESPGKIDDVFLVDRENDFAEQLKT